MKTTKMLMTIGAAVTLSCIVSGCISNAPEYHIYIDPAFTEDHQAYIQGALQEWTDRTGGGIVFSTSIETLWGEPGKHAMYIFPTTRAGVKAMCPNGGGHTTPIGCTRQEPRTDSAIIAIATDDNDSFLECSLHEIGHGLGLAHDAPGTVMFFSTGGAANHTTCKDIQQIDELRHTHYAFSCEEWK